MHIIKRTLILSTTLILAGCGSTQVMDGAPTGYVNINKISNPKVVPLKKSRYGNPT